ncbi:MAG: hypothetical protein H6835_02420 [Planctomycetes bacterium]|nr:hypothetical protein [Planctomycetota bacterium]
MTSTRRRSLPIFPLLVGLAACGSEAAEVQAATTLPGNATPVATASTQGSNRARFTYRVDLQGMPGTLTMDVEVIGSSGLTWGPGPAPSITGVIGTGDYTIYTAGRLVSGTASYVFTGENQFADFTDQTSNERFRVQWVLTGSGLRMVVNPFGPGPATYDCVLTGSQLL